MTVLSIALLVLLAGTWLVLRHKRDLSPLFLLALATYLFLWNTFPVLYGATLLDWSASFASRSLYERLVVVHLAALLITLLLFLLMPSRVIGEIRDVLGTRRTSPETARVALVVGALVYFVGLKQTLALRGASYSETTAFVMSAGATAAGQVAILDTASYLVLCLAMACIVASWPRHGRSISVLAWAIVGIAVVSNLLQGVRAVILLPLALLIALSLQRSREGRRGHWKVLVIVFGATVVLAPLLAAAMGAMRLGGSDALDLAAIEQGYELTVANLTVEQRARLAAQELNTKFNAFSYGASLLETDGVSTAGWKPYSSALLSPIPRLLLPDKPVPTSKNGDNTGTPYRVAGQPFGAIELGMVVPVSPVGVAIWELGYWGVVLVVVLNLVAWLVANSLLAAGSILSRTLGVSLLSLPSTEFLFGAPSGIVRDLPRVLLYLLVLWVIIAAWRAIQSHSFGVSSLPDPRLR